MPKSEVNNTIETSGRVFTVREVAELLQLHTSTVLQLLKDGVIRGFRTRKYGHGRWRITEAELNKYITTRGDK